MDIKDFQAGVYADGYQHRYFVPECINHTFYWTDPAINELLEKASLKLGELNSLSRFVPDVTLYIAMHTKKEAVVSSKIEGTRTNIEEAFADEQEIAAEKKDDWKEVNNYVEALNFSIGELEKLPISSRLITKAHKTLLSSVRGEHRNPGDYRRSQNWIGGATLADATFIPPAHTELERLLGDLEQFINNDQLKVPHLIKAAIMHYQFETIHPFLDGNGRVGRLLISLYLVANKLLDKPLLYLSEFFEKNKTQYYDNLTIVREKNDLGQWIKFFLVGIEQTADNAAKTLKAIAELKTAIETRKIPLMGKRSTNAVRLLRHLFQKPVTNAKEVGKVLNISAKAANDLIQVFIGHSILVQLDDYKRNRTFIFKEYMEFYEPVINRLSTRSKKK